MNEAQQKNITPLSSNGDVVDLMDVIGFLGRWWKLILSSGALASIAAVVYANSIQPEYQAQALIMMAKAPIVVAGDLMARPQSNWALGNGITYENVEPPDILAERMTIPTTYSSRVMTACQFSSPDELLHNFRVVSANGVTSTLKFAILHRSPALAEQCAGAVAEMIRDQQSVLLAEALERRNSLLHKGQRGLPGIDTRLVAPIYAPVEPIGPQKRRIVASWGSAGLILGTLAGLLWTMVAWYYRKTAVPTISSDGLKP